MQLTRFHCFIDGFLHPLRRELRLPETLPLAKLSPRGMDFNLPCLRSLAHTMNSFF
jgi:hypothetical protein